jgi:hypothetical protein
MARWTHPPPELGNGVRVGIAGKGLLAAATSTLPHGLAIRGWVRLGLGIFHLRARSVPASSGRGRVR